MTTTEQNLPSHVRNVKLAPTADAIDAWRAQTVQYKDGAHYSTDYASFMVNIRTKAGRWRCVTSRIEHNGETYYWTIRGEGSSNGCRETAIREGDIVAAMGHVVGADKLPADVHAALCAQS